MSFRNYGASYSDRIINTEAARIAGRSPIMDKVAADVLASIKAVAERHRASGDYVQSLKIVRGKGKFGVEDRGIIADDPNAVSIEYGHFAGKKGTEGRSYVQGQFILTQGANAYRKGL